MRGEGLDTHMHTDTHNYRHACRHKIEEFVFPHSHSHSRAKAEGGPAAEVREGERPEVLPADWPFVIAHSN